MKNITYLEDDGLEAPEVGAWAEEKYERVRIYAEMFTTSMRDKWGALVYIDLFAASGRSRIKRTNRILAASPLLALGIKNPFDHYIFCEKDSRRLAVLKERISRHYPDANVSFVLGDANETLSRVVDLIPRHRPGFTVLTFCFVDPYACSDLRFETIRALAKNYVDFLVLIPSGFDANRNEKLYLQHENTTLDEFLGDPNWRLAWQQEKAKFKHFGDFVTDYFGRQMRTLNYSYTGLQDSVLIRSDGNLRLYDLAFFSRHPLGKKFWASVQSSVNPQQDLF
jgi:three-Cys-motif partner protein